MNEAEPRSESLPRALIIRRRIIFEAGRTKAKRYANKYLALNFLARDRVRQKAPELTSQVAFITPKRLGSAPVRNRLRRQMREIYRRQIGPLPQPQAPYQIWVARPAALELNFAQLKEAMTELFARYRQP